MKFDGDMDKIRKFALFLGHPEKHLCYFKSKLSGMSVHFRDVLPAKSDDTEETYPEIIYYSFSADLFEGDMLFPISSKPEDVS